MKKIVIKKSCSDPTHNHILYEHCTRLIQTYVNHHDCIVWRSDKFSNIAMTTEEALLLQAKQTLFYTGHLIVLDIDKDLKNGVTFTSLRKNIIIKP